MSNGPRGRCEWRQSGLITLLAAFGRQNCRSVNWTATHVNKHNFLKAPTSNIDDKGTILAQVAVRGGFIGL